MEPINQKDINLTFLKFLAIFLVTVGLIMGAIYFDAFIPKKEMAKLKLVKNNYDTDKDYQKNFKVKLNEINQYFASMDSAQIEGYNFDYLLGLKIAELTQQVEYQKKRLLERTDMDLREKSADSSRLGMYSEMIYTLQLLHKNQLENISMKRMVKPMQEYKEANEKYQESYNTLQSELTSCQAKILDLYSKNGLK